MVPGFGQCRTHGFHVPRFQPHARHAFGVARRGDQVYFCVADTDRCAIAIGGEFHLQIEIAPVDRHRVLEIGGGHVQTV
jgi:hypothetical protein